MDRKYHLNKIGNHLNIWLGLLKIVNHKGLLAEKEFENIDGDPNELSLFSCVVLANIHWIPSAKVLCIKICTLEEIMVIMKSGEYKII